MIGRKFTIRKDSRVIICTGFFYCGGTLVLSELCRCLRKLGYDARLFPLEPYPQKEGTCVFVQNNYRSKSLKILLRVLIFRLLPFRRIFLKLNIKYYFPRNLRGCRRKWLPFFNDNDIVIYPETVYGNPLNAKNVARWQLYHFKNWGDSKAFSDRDLFIGYREVFNDRNKTPDVENIHISCFDKSLYRRYNFGPRSGKCYIVRKGRNRKDIPSALDGVVVDCFSEEEKVRVFNECEYCISYDTQTFYSSIAAICGCKSIVIPEPGKNKNDYLSDGEHSYGVAWSMEEQDICRAQGTVDKILENIQAFDRNNMNNAERLIHLLEEYFRVNISRIKK